jgi:hypothetical protein
VAPSLLSTITVLALGAFVHPSLAATGSCDQPLDAPPMSPSDDRKLTISVINHGSSSAAATNRIPLEVDNDVNTDAPREPVGEAAGPRVEEMLRRIFDEAQARQPTLPEPEADDDFSAPFAVDKSENAEESASGLEADPAEGTSELPRFGADELLHYRQQMYRTDI